MIRWAPATSKVFTATALACAVTTGDIALDEPVLHHITYRHLATHTAGLPRGGVGLLDALQAVPGAGFNYSNEGVAALGALLGPDYEAVIRERIGLPDVTTVLDVEQLGRLAPGHDENGRPVVTPTYPLGAPSGGLYGTIADLLVFVRQYLTPDAARRLAVTDRLCWMVDGERVWQYRDVRGRSRRRCALRAQAYRWPRPPCQDRLNSVTGSGTSAAANRFR